MVSLLAGAGSVACMGGALYLVGIHTLSINRTLRKLARLRLLNSYAKEVIHPLKRMTLWYARYPLLGRLLGTLARAQALLSTKSEEPLRTALYRKDHRDPDTLMVFRKESAALSLVISTCFLVLAMAIKPSTMFFAAALGAQVLVPALRAQRVLSRAASYRKLCEEQLPDMLSLLVLVVRAGATFDTALARYASSFDTELATETRRLYEAYTSGISTRSKALEDFARSIDSEPVYRFVASVKRSVLSGGSLVEVLEVQLHDMRAFKRERIEEEIAKKPVKLLIPLGLFILPAMLILLLGPVLMEVMSGMQAGI